MRHHTIKGLDFFNRNQIRLSRAVDGATDGRRTTDLAHGDLQTQVSVDVDHNLNLAAGLDTLDSKLSNRLLSLPDDLTDLLFLVILIGEIGVLVVSGLLLLRLGLGLGDLDVTGTLADADQDITTLLGGRVVSDAASGKSSLSVKQGLESGLSGGSELNTNSLAQVGSNSDHGVNGLLNVLVVELLDQGGLESGTAGRQLRGVDSRGEGRGGQDGGLLGEDVTGQLGDLRGVGSTAGEDDLAEKY